jgi:hypothetical protein
MKVLIKEDNEEREKGSRNGLGEGFVGVLVVIVLAG